MRESCPLKCAGSFDARKTFECGQCFRFDYDAETGRYSGIMRGKYAEFTPDGGEIICEPDDLDVWRDFLALDADYDAIDRSILAVMPDEITAAAVNEGRGIRILRQDGWEALCSFIISQNNNIPRIRKIIGALCRRYGEEISDGIFAFPDADTLARAGEDEIFALRTGFRAKYIHDAACRVASGKTDLAEISALPYDEAAAKLCEIKGVGPKVAACTLLFGFGKTEAFPIDVWIRRTLDKYYGGAVDTASMGGAAGIFQQYLFYYERTLSENN